jgi:mannose-6-phosphate isomerase-like protein (cupin superfamily)
VTEPASSSRTLRVDSLSPTWWTPHAREPGYLRWIVSYVGGPPGFINNNPETGFLSERVVAGLMWLPIGNRQYGVHVHTVTEIYVILKGRVESVEPGGTPHVAGPLDCLYIPAGSPHAVRAIGDEDVLLLWVHDALEPEGASQYFDDDEPRPDGAPSVSLIRWEALEPRWTTPGAKQGGHMRWATSWVGGGEGLVHFNREAGATSDRIAFGATVVPPGNAQVPHSHGVVEHYVVARGQAAVLGEPGLPPLGPCDFATFPAGEVHGFRAVGDEPLHLLWIHEELEGMDAAVYEPGDRPSWA